MSRTHLGLGAALREFRTDQHLSQEDLAHRAALHPTWISHLESGVRTRRGPPSADSRPLNITLADLAARAEALGREHNDTSQPG